MVPLSLVLGKLELPLEVPDALVLGPLCLRLQFLLLSEGLDLGLGAPSLRTLEQIDARAT